mgnify:CR=1 FL=1
MLSGGHQRPCASCHLPTGSAIPGPECGGCHQKDSPHKAELARFTQCATCHLRDLCLPCGMSGQEVDELDSLMFSRRKVAAGQDLYQEGERFAYIYAARSGTFKTSLTLPDGREQVVPLLPGTAHTIPLGAHFQFRNPGAEPLAFVIVTMPPWPGMDEAVRVTDHWATSEA